MGLGLYLQAFKIILTCTGLRCIIGNYLWQQQTSSVYIQLMLGNSQLKNSIQSVCFYRRLGSCEFRNSSMTKLATKYIWSMHVKEWSISCWTVVRHQLSCGTCWLSRTVLIWRYKGDSCLFPAPIWLSLMPVLLKSFTNSLFHFGSRTS